MSKPWNRDIWIESQSHPNDFIKWGERKISKMFYVAVKWDDEWGNQTSVCENVLNVVYADDYLELVLLQVSIHHTWYRNDYRLISQHN